MSNYEKQNFVSGQILKAEHLNHMEDGIEQLSGEIVKTVNGVRPDENGNVVVSVSGGGETEEPIKKTGTVVTIDAEQGAKITINSDIAKPITLVHQGKNFLPSGLENIVEKVENGVTARANEDGSTTFTGTCESVMSYHLMYSAFKTKRIFPAGEYVVSINFEGTGNTFLYVDNGNEGLASLNKDKTKQTFVLDSPAELTARIEVYAGAVDMTIYCQIERGSEVSGYEKFFADIKSITLPYSVKARPGVNVLYTESSDVITATYEPYDNELISALMDNTTVEYNTVAEMLADKKLAIGHHARTRGYYSSGDGGAARYTVDGTNNGYGLVSVNGFCNIVGEARMSPKMFGAIADGEYYKTDDTAAFQSCLDFCSGRAVVDVTDACYVIGGVKLYHGKTYDIVSGNPQRPELINKLPGSIVVKLGHDSAFVGSDEQGVDNDTGLPLVIITLQGVKVSGYYSDVTYEYPTFIKDVHLTQSSIKGIYADYIGCFFDGVMTETSISDCFIRVSYSAFRNYRVVNGDEIDGFVDCKFYSNSFMGIMRNSYELFKPVVFEAYSIYPNQFSANFVGAMWAIVACNSADSSTNGYFHGWHSLNNVYSFVYKFITDRNGSDDNITGQDIQIFGDRIWNCSRASLVDSVEGSGTFSDENGNTRIEGDKTPFFNFNSIIYGEFRDVVAQFCDSLFPETMRFIYMTATIPTYMNPPKGSDSEVYAHLFDTKIPINHFIEYRETGYKYSRIELWNNRVVDTLPIIQDEEYRYALEGQTCYYANKLLTCHGDNWYDTMGNVVTA